MLDSCTIPELNPETFHFRIPMTVHGRNKSIEVAAMVDSGATSLFVGQTFVERNQVFTHKLLSVATEGQARSKRNVRASGDV